MADPTLQITVTQGPDTGKKLLLEPGKTYRIGCGSEDDLVLTDPMVLKGHCSVEVSEQGVILRNHTASAGTFIGDKKISQARIPAKATFRIGESHIQIRPAAVPRQNRSAPGGPTKRGGPNDPLVGKIVGGYKLLEVVGRGGMGTVYKAVQLSLQREVALKVLARKYARDENFRDLFINEARAAAQLVDPNIVQVYDAGSEGDVTFFSMEFISEGSVEEILQREKKIPWEEAILMVLEAAHGLKYAEGKQIVHRDIKPDNLMLNADGRIKIADLGLAKQGGGGADQGIIGTPHFIPPEQALGKQVDSRADIYSLGATFFRMITGRTLFSGKTAREIVLKHIKEPAPAASSLISGLPDELDGVLARMLAKEPDARYANSTELVEALETVCANHGIKGAIIKRGVSKKVLVPLLLLLLGAGYAIFHFAMKEPEQYIDPVAAAKQEADREARRNAERERKVAQRNLRRGKVVTAWGQLELEFAQAGGIKGVRKHRDEDDEQGDALEAGFEAIAKHYDAFANRDDVKEFDGELGYIAKTGAQAKEIRDTIREVKQTVASKRKQIDDWVVTATALYKKERDALSTLSVAQKFSDAFIKAEELGRDKPLPNDPLEKLLAQEWVSPLNPRVRQSARDTKRVTDIVAKAREYFAQEKSDIPDRAEAAWKAVLKHVPEPADFARIIDDKPLEVALERLKPVIDNFGNREPKIKDCWDAAQSRQRLIKEELQQRRQTRIVTDRARVRDTLRMHRSLDPDVRPNSVMDGDFADAKAAWQRLLDAGTVKTDRYRAFVRERIEAVRYIEYLFSQFRVDVIKTDALRSPKEAPLRSLACEFEMGGRTFKFKLDKPKDDAPDRFCTNKKYKGNKSFRYGSFGMDWVFESVFRVPGGNPAELRWRNPTPVIRFSLALFLFETMQYSDAVEMFDSLVKDETYGAVARSFADRSRAEAAARAEYEGLIRKAHGAKKSAEIREIQLALTKFGQTHAATLFWVDVMPNARALAVDIAPEASVKVPSLPPAPDPVK